MLKTKPQPGTKIRCVDDGGYDFLTKGKIYEVIKGYEREGADDGFFFLDDEGDDLWRTNVGWGQEKFELVQEEETQMNNTNSTNTTEQTPDEFKVGDVVWDVIQGKGRVTGIENQSTYEVKVLFDNGGWDTYLQDGRRYMEDWYPRTLFFSEPKIEASVTRPFVPTLVGKRVVVQYFDETWTCHPVVVTAETEEEIFTKNGSDYKGDLIAICEVSSENLLTSKK